MDNKNFLKDIYDDFFGIEKLKEENERLAKEVGLKIRQVLDYASIDSRSETQVPCRAII